MVVPILVAIISSRCLRQPHKLPILPEIAPDDGSATDEDWKYIFKNSVKSTVSSKSGAGGGELKVFQASTSIIEDDLQEANNTLLIQSFGNSQSLKR